MPREENFFLRETSKTSKFKKNHFYPKITPHPSPPPFGNGSHENYNLLSSYPIDATYQIYLVKIGQGVLEKMLTDTDT